MAARSKLFTRFRTPRTPSTEKSTTAINLVILDIDLNDIIINNINIQIKIFTKDEIDACIDYITSEITNVYLFLSNDISNTLIPSIFNIEHIKSIYILHKNDFDAKEKSQNVFYDLNEMIKQFKEDINGLDDKIYSEKSTFQNINPESAEILWWKIFDKILQHIQHTNIAKDEIIDFFKELYPNGKHSLKQIEEFRDRYTSDTAIYWYTRNSFLYHLVNQTLRTKKNLSNLFKLRLFLTDLVHGLKTAQLDVHNNNIHYPLKVYRGTGMRLEDIEQIRSNIGNSIFFGNFVSTSIIKEIAQLFVGSSDTNFSPQGVLFRIEINSLNNNSDLTPFAYISRYSEIQDEEEVLISMHSLFLVQSVELLADNIWQIDLTFKNDIWDIDFDLRSIFSAHADQIFIRHLSKENKQFIAFQVFIDMIIRPDQTQYAKKELIEFARSKYKNNSKQMENIDDFEQNYLSEDAAKWYTKDSFLYRILNESLRIEIIDSIFKMRYFIHDLHNHLAQSQTSFIQSLNGEKNVILHRGHPMKIIQLNEIRENIGGLISMNSFMSATQDENVAIVFSGNGETTEPDEVSVIYEMLIDTDIRSTPYAKIETVMNDEQEILFSMGSIFRIKNVDELRHRVYYVKLTMEHIEDELWNKLTAHLD